MSDTDADKQCLFFDAQGRGPSVVRLIERAVRQERDGDQIVAPRAFGLCWEVTGPLRFVEDGGFMLTSDVAAWLRDQLTSWLDAPRLAARSPISSRSLIDVDYQAGVALIKSTAGEWGVIDSDGLSNAPGWLDGYGLLHHWYATEAEGRAAYRDETGKVICESCTRFIDRDDALADRDGIYTCADESACSAACAAEDQR